MPLGKDFVAFSMIGACVIDSAGYKRDTPQSSLPCALQMKPWCNEKFTSDFLKTIPFIPRVFIFPAWHKTYLAKWKPMIESIAGTEDVLRLGEKHDNCACIIS